MHDPEQKAEEKTHDFEAGRILGPDGKLISIVKGRTVYREVTPTSEPEPRGGTYV